jgi:hypothetical protein
MKTPDIQTYTSYQKFLKDLYQFNRKASGVGSYRFYAQKLKWPVSYLNEVIAGKKKFTLNRSLELGMFLKLDAIDIERLIFLTLKDSDNDKIKDYFTSKVEKEGKTEGYFDISQKKQTSAENMLLVSEEIYSDISLLAIADVIVMYKGQIKLTEISKLLYSFPELQDPKVLLRKIEILEKNEIIKRKFENRKIIGFEFKRDRLAFSIDAKTVKHMAQYAENYAQIIEGQHPKGWITSGFIKLSKDRLFEAKKRILAFRNWLLELETEVLNDPNYDKKNVLIFQMDMNLISILDCAHLGITNLDQWMSADTQAKKK